jgi:hypothetical protein
MCVSGHYPAEMSIKEAYCPLQTEAFVLAKCANKQICPLYPLCAYSMSRKAFPEFYISTSMLTLLPHLLGNILLFLIQIVEKNIYLKVQFRFDA